MGSFKNHLIILILIGYGCRVSAGTPELPVKSRSGFILIEGSTNIGDFELEYHFSDSLTSEKDNASYPADCISRLIIPAAEFTARSPRLEKDFCSLVKSEEYPNIYIEFIGLTGPLRQGNNLAEAISISLAGTERSYRISYLTRNQENKTMCMEGSFVIPFSDFNLEPPSRLMGIVKVKDSIHVKFSVIFTLDPNS